MKLVGMPFHLLRYTDAQNKAFRIVSTYMLEVLKEEMIKSINKEIYENQENSRIKKVHDLQVERD